MTTILSFTYAGNKIARAAITLRAIAQLNRAAAAADRRNYVW